MKANNIQYVWLKPDGKLGLGNSNPEYQLDVTGTARITGTLTAGNININQTITSPKLVTNRITCSDTNGIHFGDSSLVIASPTPTGNNPISSATNVPYEKLYVSGSLNNLAIGHSGNIAVGVNSIAIGPNLIKAYGKNSIAIGMAGTETDGNQSMAIGYKVKTAQAANNSIALGAGSLSTGPMTNNKPNSLAVGFNSDVPTFIVTGGNGNANSIGTVGIGTINPAASLHVSTKSTSLPPLVVESTSGNPVNLLQVDPDGSTSINSTGGFIFTVKDNFYEFLKVNSAGNTRITSRPGNAYGLIVETHQIPNFGINTWLDIDNPATTAFRITNPTDVFEIKGDGTTHIGAQRVISGPHMNALLTVSGKIACQEVRVFTNSTGTIWADYVFDKDYKLMPWKKLADYIEKNNHLPDVPTTKNIMENGNDLGQTDVILLQKTEENTLYIIELNKKFEKLEKENEELKILVKKLSQKK